MSLADDIGPDDIGPDGDDLLAAEYVLGVQPIDERRVVAARIDAEQTFARLVDGWQARFAPLTAAFDAVEVPASVKAAIDQRLFSGSPVPARLAAREPARPGMFVSLAFWRALSFASLATLLLYIALPLLSTPPADVARDQFVASLVADNSAVHFLAVYDEGANEIGLSHVAGERAAGRDFELWVIEGQQAPISLGVVPAGASTRLPVSEALRQKMISGAVVAITDEPSGGSPSGLPTGEVVAAGDLRAI